MSKTDAIWEILAAVTTTYDGQTVGTYNEAHPLYKQLEVIISKVIQSEIQQMSTFMLGKDYVDGFNQ
jgi:hypothetical protein